MNEFPIVFCIANQKGGVGKTTSAVNLAASLAVSERRTLLIDMDPQGNASSAFGIVTPTRQIYDSLVGGHPLSDVTCDTELEYLKIIPSGKDLVGAEIELVEHPQREKQLANRVRALRDQRAGYDFVLIDCPPSLGLLTLNALVAADRLLVPLQAEYYALEGLAHLMDTIERIRGAFNPDLELEGILLTMFDGRNNLGRQVAAEVRTHFGKRVFDSVIPRNVRLSEAPSFGKPALLYDARSAGALAYLQVASELLQRYPAPRQPEVAKSPSDVEKRPKFAMVDRSNPRTASTHASFDASISTPEGANTIDAPIDATDRLLPRSPRS